MIIGSCSGAISDPNELRRLIILSIFGTAVGFAMGIYFSNSCLTKFNFSTGLFSVEFSQLQHSNTSLSTEALLNLVWIHSKHGVYMNHTSKIYMPSNPNGAETLPPGILVPESDFFLHRLSGKPSEDLPVKQKYLVTFTVAYKQKQNIDAAVNKFSGNFTILLFHYDGRSSEWDEFEWSKRAIHISARKQTKWWYAKRFLHPDIVAAYDYIFIWDEDLGVQNFNAERYIEVVREYGLEISQPALDLKLSQKPMHWNITGRQEGHDVHKVSQEPICSHQQAPPCAGFVEIMAPVFSRNAWRCAWHLIQNDLVHGWGLDLAISKCVEPAYEKMGVVDAQWIVHQGIPSLGEPGQTRNGTAARQGVLQRCNFEWGIFRSRMADAERKYFQHMNSRRTNSST